MTIYEGYGADITLDGDDLILTKKGMTAKISGGPRQRRIPISALSDVEFKDASRLINGSLQIVIGSEWPGRAEATDPNTVMFTRKSQNQFAELRDTLLTKIHENRQRGVDSTHVAVEPLEKPQSEKLAGRQQSLVDRSGELAEQPSEIQQKQGIFARRRDERRAKQAGRDEFETVAMRAAAGDPDAVAELPNAVAGARTLYRSGQLEKKLWNTMAMAVRSVIDDDVLTVAEEEHIYRLGDILGTPVQQMEKKDYALFEEFIIAGINDGRFPRLDDPSIMLKKGEEAYGSFAASLMKEQAIREFRAGTSSVSIPLGGGVRYRVGGVRGKSVVVGTELVVQVAGALTVTNQRSVFAGQAKTLEFRHDRLVGMEQFTDGLRLNVSNRQTASLFRLQHPSIAGALITAAVAQAE